MVIAFYISERELAMFLEPRHSQVMDMTDFLTLCSSEQTDKQCLRMVRNILSNPRLCRSLIELGRRYQHVQRREYVTARDHGRPGY